MGIAELVTDELVAAYSRDGAVRLRQAFGPEWIATLTAGIERNIVEPSDRGRFWDRDADGRTTFYDSQSWLHTPEYRDFAFRSDVAEIAGRLMEVEAVDLVLLDIWLGGMDGLQALREIRRRYELPVIMISGHGTIETAVQATREGAFDFIEKPLSYDKVVLSIKQGLHVARLEQENRLLRDGVQRRHPELTGHSPAISAVRQQIERVAPTDAWVLILGAHGTGKELVAQAIHRRSRRSGRPMIAVNCAAIPEDLIESELFGHEKGAFTGAESSRRGKFDLANGSTLFLDEIGDMSLKSQAKVLRILQEQKFERVGGNRTIEVDVRVLAATNKNLEEEIERGRFRADLYFRLNVVPIRVPLLRERLEDIPELVADFLRLFQAKGLEGWGRPGLGQ